MELKLVYNTFKKVFSSFEKTFAFFFVWLSPARLFGKRGGKEGDGGGGGILGRTKQNRLIKWFFFRGSGYTTAFEVNLMSIFNKGLCVFLYGGWWCCCC